MLPIVLGVCKELDAQGSIKVAFPGSAGAVTAKLAMLLDAERVQQAIVTQQAVVLLLENGDLTRPIIMGLIEPAVVLSSVAAATVETSSPTGNAANVIEADVDGKRVRVVGQDEIVLQCGSASVTLRRNGRVLIRGTHVETYSEGTNRIKGGQVRIN